MPQPSPARTYSAATPRGAFAGIDYERAPLGLVVGRYLTPFWLFQDASKGDRMSRAAAYRHNRSMRTYLPGYIRKWALQAAFALLLTFLFDSLAAPARPRFDCYVLFAAGAGIAFACCLCMLIVMGYTYLYLARHDYR